MSEHTKREASANTYPNDLDVLGSSARDHVSASHSATRTDLGRQRISVENYHALLRERHDDAEPTAVPMCNAASPFRALVLKGLPKDIDQPPLTDDVFSLHLGPDKRVDRHQDGRRTSHEITTGSFILIPHDRPVAWRTAGPINLVHIIPDPQAFDDLATGEIGRSRNEIEFTDQVGATNRILVGLAMEMVRLAQAEIPETRLYRDTLFTAFSLALLRHCSAERAVPTLLGTDRKLASGGMAGWRLRRVTDFVRSNLAVDIGLDDLTRVSGLSRAQFFRAFRQSVGCTPGRYLMQMRVEAARGVIERGGGLCEAAASSGFSSAATMAHAFRRIINLTPDMYRRWHRGA